MKILILSLRGDALPIAAMLEREGADVSAYVHENPGVYDGLVQRVGSDIEVIREWAGGDPAADRFVLADGDRRVTDSEADTTVARIGMPKRSALGPPGLLFGAMHGYLSRLRAKPVAGLVRPQEVFASRKRMVEVAKASGLLHRQPYVATSRGSAIEWLRLRSHETHALYHESETGDLPHFEESAPDTMEDYLASPLGEAAPFPCVIERIGSGLRYMEAAIFTGRLASRPAIYLRGVELTHLAGARMSVPAAAWWVTTQPTVRWDRLTLDKPCGPVVARLTLDGAGTFIRGLTVGLDPALAYALPRMYTSMATALSSSWSNGCGADDSEHYFVQAPSMAVSWPGAGTVVRMRDARFSSLFPCGVASARGTNSEYETAGSRNLLAVAAAVDDNVGSAAGVASRLLDTVTCPAGAIRPPELEEALWTLAREVKKFLPH